MKASQHNTGAYTKWTDWSKCTADCEKDPNHAVMTRTQTNLADPTDVRIQEIPCESPCPPGTKNIQMVTGRSESIETSVDSFLIDCSQLDLDLRQVSKGPSYEMSSNMTRPATDKALSVTIVSHILRHNNSKLISEK